MLIHHFHYTCSAKCIFFKYYIEDSHVFLNRNVTSF